jgi:hypothetical protein
MSLKQSLESDVGRTFREQWEVQTAGGVPAPENLRLGSNHAKDLEKARSCMPISTDRLTWLTNMTGHLALRSTKPFCTVLLTLFGKKAASSLPMMATV